MGVPTGHPFLTQDGFLQPKHVLAKCDDIFIHVFKPLLMYVKIMSELYQNCMTFVEFFRRGGHFKKCPGKSYL